ncbi:MAG: 3'-5' exonuclease, partial [Cyclobacteriaceae bacterium]
SLINNGIPSRLIQSNEGFNLYQLFEIRYFFNLLDLREDAYLIDEQAWSQAKRKWSEKFRSSARFSIIKQLIHDFEKSHPVKKYQSDLLVFIRESRLEDFYMEYGDVVLVSTIHKAKGKEFDNVFLMLSNFNPRTDAMKRLLYVGMTRAKNFLGIHLNADFLDDINAGSLERIDDPRAYDPPKKLAMQLSFKDVWLDYFIKRQNLVIKLLSGTRLQINGNQCLNQAGQPVLTFSKLFVAQLENLANKGYLLKSGKVNHQVYWQKEGMEKEVLIILPELVFESSPSE